MSDNSSFKDKTRRLLTEHYRAYPELRTEDIFKYLFQSSFGCEHLVSSYDRALGYIENEYQTVSREEEVRTEPLDGEYSRLYLSWINKGLSTATLARIFCLSAKVEADGRALLVEKLQIARELIKDGALPIDEDDFESKLAAWREIGYPAVRHSDTFREIYRPAYRVVADRYAHHAELLAKIDRLRSDGALSISFAVDSDDAELEKILGEVYECRVEYRDGILALMK